MRCPSCGFENPEAQKFCGECGRKLASPAPVRYTPPHLAERLLAEQGALDGRAAREGERKTVTALFADIKGSMDLIESLDVEEARAVVDPTLQLMMDAVHRYEGYVAQATGDGIFALFGAPIAHEDHPQRALFAALSMQEEIGRYAKKLRLDKGINLEIRVGINTGEVVLRSVRKDDLRTDYVPIGHSTSLAARMESLAAPGTIVVSEYTQKLVEGRFQLHALGPARVKGVSHPVELFEVVGVGSVRTRLELSERRGLVRFVGRERELAEVRRAFELANQGRGQIVAVVGDPGVGKSRLLHEFGRKGQAGCLFLEASAVSHGKAYPYLPLIELLRSYFRLSAEDAEETRREKVVGKVRALDEQLEDAVPYLLSLVGVADAAASLQMDAEIRRKRTVDAVKRLLLRETLVQPVVLIVEDLHWMDGETEAFLDSLGESIASARLLLITNYRPEYRHRWASRSNYTQVRLDPLDEGSIREMLAALLGGDETLDGLKKLIIAKTEGNPFFTEEIVRELFERGVLARNGGIRLTRAVTAVDIPTTVDGVLTSRIDRLSDEEKTLLQSAAVIGREFPWSLIRCVADLSDDDLHRLLSRLQRAELVFERPAFPEPEYVFKHALTREASYGSVLAERRRELHERTARAIETLFADRLEDHYGELAEHYTRSGNVEKAIDYLTLAGRYAIQRSRYSEGAARLREALAILPLLDSPAEAIRRELGVQTALGPALIAMHGYGAPEVAHTYSRADELSQGGGDPRRRFSVLRGLWVSRFVHSKYREALAMGRELLTIAESLDDANLRLDAHRAIGEPLLHLGELAEARSHLEQAAALLGPMRRGSIAEIRDLSAPACLSYLSWTLWMLGHADQALRESEHAIALARDVEDPHNLALALAFSAQTRVFRRDTARGREEARAAIALATEHGFPQWKAIGEVLEGWAIASDGASELGILQMRHGLASHLEIVGSVMRPVWLGLLADALIAAGKNDEAAAVLDEATTAANEETWWNAELLRLKGELATANAGDAEHSFREAIEVARAQGARSLELRATASLATLLGECGKRTEARASLAEIQSWFTEGRETEDQRQARALLDELRSETGLRVEPADREGDRTFRREGDFWTVAYEGNVARLKDSKGLRYLSQLLRHPGREFHTIELAGLEADPAGGTGKAPPAELSVSRLESGEEILDSRARAEYRERLADLHGELEEARGHNDAGRVERLESEIETLERELAAALGFAGRGRKATPVAERSRVAVTKAIREAITRIERHIPPLGQHLRKTIRTGWFCGYEPPERQRTDWLF